MAENDNEDRPHHSIDKSGEQHKSAETSDTADKDAPNERVDDETTGSKETCRQE